MSRRERRPIWVDTITIEVFSKIHERLKQASVVECEALKAAVAEPPIESTLPSESMTQNQLSAAHALAAVNEIYLNPISLASWVRVPEGSRPQTAQRIRLLIQQAVNLALQEKTHEAEHAESLAGDLGVPTVQTETAQTEEITAAPLPTQSRSMITSQPHATSQPSHGGNGAGAVLGAAAGLIYYGASDWSTDGGVLHQDGPNLGFYDHNSYIGVNDGDFMRGHDTTTDFGCCGSAEAEHHSIGDDGIIHNTTESQNYCGCETFKTTSETTDGGGIENEDTSGIKCCGAECYTCETGSENGCHDADLDCCGADIFSCDCCGDCCGNDCCDVDCCGLDVCSTDNDCCSCCGDCNGDICETLTGCFGSIGDCLGGLCQGLGENCGDVIMGILTAPCAD